jgi:hypothetical protein
VSLVEAATTWSVDWFDNRRLYRPLGDIPPPNTKELAGGPATMRLATPAHGRYLLIRFTRRPPGQGRPLPGKHLQPQAEGPRTTHRHEQDRPAVGDAMPAFSYLNRGG